MKNRGGATSGCGIIGRRCKWWFGDSGEVDGSDDSGDSCSAGLCALGGLLVFSFSSGNDRVLKKPVLSSDREADSGADSFAELSTSPAG